MNSKEEVKKLNLQGIEIDLPFPVVVEGDIVSLSSVLKKEFEIIKQSLDRLEQLEKENTELKQLVKEQFEKIQRDSGKMASMDCELRRLKGEFIPQECEG